jgi:hypothetical protein
MMRMLLTVAVLGSAGSFAGLAMAQSKQGEPTSSDVSTLVARLQAQCVHRRATMPPDERDHCARILRDAQSNGQNGASANNQAAPAGPGNVGAIGPGNTGPGNSGRGNGNQNGNSQGGRR